MATGDAADFLTRLRRRMPARWFPDTAPVLSAVLTGWAATWAALYALLAFVKAQQRISTATGTYLDLISHELFGPGILPRLSGESDAAFRVRIKLQVPRLRNTRAALVQALTALSGSAPWVFEPTNPSDTGGYGSAGMLVGSGLGYGAGGGYGTLSNPMQVFVIAAPPGGGTMADVYLAIEAVRPAAVTVWTR